ncbi:hypothetical protein PF003_g7668 [Phytophthora fragariae]|nr:hypothetical protein PF003_g7668 [Phytophthora fragariae]
MNYDRTRFSMLNNYIHGTSGRSATMGGEREANVLTHVANNFLGQQGSLVRDWCEGNYVGNTTMPLFTGGSGAFMSGNGESALKTVKYQRLLNTRQVPPGREAHSSNTTPTVRDSSQRKQESSPANGSQQSSKALTGGQLEAEAKNIVQNVLCG